MADALRYLAEAPFVVLLLDLSLPDAGPKPSNSNATGQLLGFRSASLSTSATVLADVVSRGGFGTDLAFDRDRNVWSPGGTTRCLELAASVAHAGLGFQGPLRAFRVMRLGRAVASAGLR